MIMLIKPKQQFSEKQKDIYEMVKERNLKNVSDKNYSNYISVIKPNS